MADDEVTELLKQILEVHQTSLEEQRAFRAYAIEHQKKMVRLIILIVLGVVCFGAVSLIGLTAINVWLGGP